MLSRRTIVKTGAASLAGAAVAKTLLAQDANTAFDAPPAARTISPDTGPLPPGQPGRDYTPCVAPNLPTLIAFRMIQAVGGSMLNPVAMSIITNVFVEPRERARAIGVWGGVVGLSMAVGPLLGGVLVDGFGWRSIFWINLPVGVAAILLAARFVPESRAPHPRRIDPVGQVLVLLLLATLTYGIIEGPAAG